MGFEPHRWAVIDDLMISVTLAGPSTDAAWGAFTLSEMDAAIAHLEVPKARISRVKAEIERLGRPV